MKAQMVILFTCIFCIIKTDIIELPEPIKEGGLPTNEVLSKRQSIKSFSENGKLSDRELSQLLWAAYGINDPESGYKTVPSSHAMFPFDVYVFLKTGIYLYDPKNNTLTSISKEDKRAITGYDSYVKNVYANICLAGKYEREAYLPSRSMMEIAMRLDAGYVNQAMYYVAANEGLEILSSPWEEEEYAISFAKDNTALQTAVNDALKELIADGSVQKVVDKYITAD